MSVWYESSGRVECNLERVTDALANLVEYNVGVVRLMPGITSVEIIEKGDDFVTIKTNEALMKRANISKRLDGERITVEFDEESRAGRLATIASHYLDEFTTSDDGIRHRIVISDVRTSGLLGFLYRTFGKRSMGKAFLKTHKTYLEQGII